MRNKKDIEELIEYLQTTEENTITFDEDSIIADYEKKSNNNQSLPIKILSVFGGILANISFLGFLFFTGLYNSEIGLLIFGGLCIIGAIILNKHYDKIIIDTISVSMFIVGFILLGFGLDRLHLDLPENSIFVIFIIIAFCSLLIVQNYILSFISVLIINGSILALISLSHNYFLIHIYTAVLAVVITYFFIKEAKIITINKTVSKLYNPIKIGLLFSFLSSLVILCKKDMLEISFDYIWTSSIIIILSILYLLSFLFKILNIKTVKDKAIIYVFTTITLSLTALSPGISGAFLIILLSFLVNYKPGLILGTLAFIYFISQYYYDLNFTLLTKSLLLFSSGILFLTFYLFTHKKLTTNEKI